VDHARRSGIAGKGNRQNVEVSVQEDIDANDELRTGAVLLGGARDERHGGGEGVLRRAVRLDVRRDADGRRAVHHRESRAWRRPRDVREHESPAELALYVNVESADDVAAKAKSLGAKIDAEPFDVGNVGRMAVITDPEGATFAIWQARKNTSARASSTRRARSAGTS
jgi:hypothetical protein